jgi:hypothetical protein
MKQCVICNQEQPPTAFSTLARRRGRTASPTEIESVACTPCYWMQLVTHYPRLSVDDNGRCAVAYIPHDKPRWEYVVEIEQRLLLWLKDEKVIEVYGVLGIIDEQIRPFTEWLAQAKLEDLP